MARVVFTGSSSFTGYWFINALRAAGHEVIATFAGKDVSSYEGIRAERVRSVQTVTEAVFDCEFGDERFDAVLREANADVFCHHAAHVTNYKEFSFDPIEATRRNTAAVTGLVRVLDQGCPRIILTGSIFEANEGEAGGETRAFSPYGLSKTLTAECFRFYTAMRHVPLAKFVIPNPFGPMEEPRFTSYLASTWLKGGVTEIKTPDYVRDNIHVSALAERYEQLVCEAWPKGFVKVNPSGYRESQRDFTLRFRAEMQPRLGVACEAKFAEQIDWSEPRTRVNTQHVTMSKNAEAKAWDALADYYLNRFRL